MAGKGHFVLIFTLRLLAVAALVLGARLLLGGQDRPSGPPTTNESAVQPRV
jgi:hypothetical protein